MELFKNNNGQICQLSEVTIFHNDGSYTKNVTKETALANGWRVYVDEATDKLTEFAIPLLNESTTITNNDALGMEVFYNEWSTYIGKNLVTGQICKYEDKLWRVRQDIATVLENQAPSIDTAALYEVVDKEHEGTFEDPIPYIAPMQIYKDKYYSEENVIYQCIRNSDTALAHSLKDLIDQYVVIIM